MGFQSFNSFDRAFQWFKKPLTIKLKHVNRNKRDKYGFASQDTNETRHVVEPILTTTNPNLTYNSVNGGQQSTIAKVWESKSIKDAPRGTIVITSKGHKFKTVSSTQLTGTKLWYYQLKEVGNRA